MRAMPSKNARRGSNFEREIVNKAREQGFRAERAYGSNGRALGESEEVDLLINKFRVQAKRRKKLASYLQIPEGADGVVFKQDRGPTLALIPLETLLELLKEPEA
jgi:Holliday junction resolvase